MNDLRHRPVGCDILGQFKMHRAGALLLRHAEGIARRGRNAPRRDDLSPSWSAAARGHNIDDPEFRLPAGVNGLLAGNHHDRHRAQKRIGR
jgi:hypothetical protein